MPSPSVPVYPPATEADRAALLNFIQSAPFRYGPWRALKSLYKQVESDPTAAPEILGALLGHFDTSPTSLPRTGDFAVHFEGLPSIAKLFPILSGESGLVCVFGAKNGYGALQPDRFAIFRLNDANPLAPERLGVVVRFEDSKADTIAVCGTIAAIGTTKPRVTAGGEVTLYDFSALVAGEGGAPRKRGTIALDAPELALAAIDRRPYIVAVVEENKGRSAGLRIISIVDPDRPEVIGSIDMRGATGLTLSEDGNTAYVSVTEGTRRIIVISFGEAAGIKAVDISNPARPNPGGTIRLENARYSIARNGLLFTGTRLDRGNSGVGLHISDLSDPLHPRLLGRWGPQWGRGITSNAVNKRGFAFVGVEWGSLYILDVRDLRSPKHVLSHPMGMPTPRSLMLNAAEDVLYIAMDYGATQAWNVANPEKPVQVGLPPTAATLGYMKRRARRAIRTLAKSDPNRYAEVASATLIAACRELDNVDPHIQWVTMDILHGGSDSYIQSNHGRGRYVVRRGLERRFQYRRREESVPAAWDVRPDLLASLLRVPACSADVAEFAIRTLRAGNHPIPQDIPSAALERWLSAGSPALISWVMGVAESQLSNLGPQALADASYFARPSQSKRLFELAMGALNRVELQRIFADQLMERIQAGTDIRGLRISRRGVRAIRTAAQYLPESTEIFQGRTLLRLGMLAPLLAISDPGVDNLIAKAAMRARMEDLPDWLRALTLAPEGRREETLKALELAVGGQNIPQRLAAALVLVGDDRFVLESGWRLLAAGNLTAESARSLWDVLLDQVTPTTALRAAMVSPHALGLLGRAGIGPAELGQRLAQRPFLVELLSPEAFGRLIDDGLSADILLRLVTVAPEGQWAGFRTVWLRRLREEVGLLALWTAAPAAVASDTSGILAHRLLNDEDLAGTLPTISIADGGERLLSIREPEFGPVLGRWLERRLSVEPRQFARDMPLLLQAATHMLPEVRTVALAHVQQVGMGLAFALRLLESEIPPSIIVGRSFFEAEPHGGNRERDHALALCDSPIASVRALGRDFVSARWATLGTDALLVALFENPAPDVQRFVADRLETTTERPAQTPEFDRDVLRSRNKARRAKEAVKHRQETEQSVDVETLLSLARGAGTPRDAEWALSQLARRALAGEQIPGLTLEGAAG